MAEILYITMVASPGDSLLEAKMAMILAALEHDATVTMRHNATTMRVSALNLFAAIVVEEK